jgi:hypothetical protein
MAIVEGEDNVYLEGFDARATNCDAAAPPKAPRNSRRRMSAPLG